MIRLDEPEPDALMTMRARYERLVRWCHGWHTARTHPEPTTAPRKDREAADPLHAAIAAYLRAQRGATFPVSASRCTRCGGPLDGGDGRFTRAVLNRARRCSACYARENPDAGH